jgi:hypothetical protein
MFLPNEESIHMAKPTKTGPAREGQIKPRPFTGDLKQAILAGLNAGPGGVLGFLDKVARENPPLDARARRYAEYFATRAASSKPKRARS